METNTNAQVAVIKNEPTTKQKVKQPFALDTITAKDLEDLDQPGRQYLADSCNLQLNKLTGVERDNFLTKIDQIIPASTKADIWEHNHTAITAAVATFMGLNGTMPTKNAVAGHTGLSRQTVARHFAAHNRRPEFTAQMEQFKFMAPHLLANVYKFALHGDMRAAKIYLEAVGATGKNQANTVVNEQNNYIQVNNTILSQESVKQLTTHQLNQIERIITHNNTENAPDLPELATFAGQENQG